MTPTVPSLAFLVHPGLLWLGVGLAAIPVVIHLLSRRQVRRLRWAAMQWLLAAVKRHQRRLRLENWLVLLLRVAALVLLGLALARPVVTDPALAGLAGTKRSVYLVLDDSYSTAARSGARSVADLVKSEADRVLSSLSGEDSVAVVVTNDARVDLSEGTEPAVLLARVVGRDGAARAKEAVAALRPRDAAARWPRALQLVEKQLTAEDVNRVVVVVTDLQARDWDPRATADKQALDERIQALLDQRCAVRVVDVGGDSRRNLVVRSVSRRGGRDAFVGRSLPIDVEVANLGRRAVERAQVQVLLDGNTTPLVRVETGRLEGTDPATGHAPEGAYQTIPLDLPAAALAAPGSHWLQVQVGPPTSDPEADDLGLDSQRVFAFRAREQIRILAWAVTGRNARLPAETYLRGVYGGFAEAGPDGGGRAEGVKPMYALEVAVTEDEFLSRIADASGRIDLVVLANVAPRAQAADALAAFVKAGGALIAFAGDSLRDPQVWNAPFHDDPDRRLLPLEVRAPEVRDRIRDVARSFRFDFERPTEHPLARPFTAEEAVLWIKRVPPRIWGRMTFAEPAAPAAATPSATDRGGSAAPSRDADRQVVLRFESEEGGASSPAVVEGSYGAGRTLWVGTAVEEGDWVEYLLPFFLPVFLDEAAVWLTRPPERDRNLEVGQAIAATLPRDGTAPRLLAPQGADALLVTHGGAEGEGASVLYDRVGSAGLWRLSFSQAGTERTEHFAVNPDPEEGALLGARRDQVRGRFDAEADLAVLGSWSEAEQEAEEVREGEATRWILWVLVGVLAAESFFAWLFGRRRSLAGEEGDVAPPRET